MKLWWSALIGFMIIPLLAAAQELPSRVLCSPEALNGRPYIDCLRQASERTDGERKAALETAFETIKAKPHVFTGSKIRWKRALEETDNLWLRLRNAECQEVAPLEVMGQPKTDLFAARLICLIDYNVHRRQELERRYRQG